MKLFSVIEKVVCRKTLTDEDTEFTCPSSEELLYIYIYISRDPAIPLLPLRLHTRIARYCGIIKSLFVNAAGISCLPMMHAVFGGANRLPPRLDAWLRKATRLNRALKSIS